MPGPAPYSKGSRSNGSRSHPCAQFIRFTEDENKKLVALCRKRGLTIQAFGHAAIMRAISEAQLGKKTDAEVTRDNLAAAPETQQTPKGLGIRDRLQQQRDGGSRDVDDDDDDRDQAPSSQAVQTQVSSVDDQVLALARTIVESPVSTRRDVMKSAIGVLARGRTREEALQLADQLDAAIKRLDGTPRTALERVRARMAK